MAQQSGVDPPKGRSEFSGKVMSILGTFLAAILGAGVSLIVTHMTISGDTERERRNEQSHAYAELISATTKLEESVERAKDVAQGSRAHPESWDNMRAAYSSVIDKAALAALVAPNSVTERADALETAARKLRDKLNVLNERSGGQDARDAVKDVDDAKRVLDTARTDFQQTARTNLAD
jgi:cytoskeletal protein RodZ